MAIINTVNSSKELKSKVNLADLEFPQLVRTLQREYKNADCLGDIQNCDVIMKEIQYRLDLIRGMAL